MNESHKDGVESVTTTVYPTVLNAEAIKRAVKYLETPSPEPYQRSVSFEAYDMVSEEDQKTSRTAMENVYKEMSGIRPEWIVTDDFTVEDFCTQEYDKEEGEKDMGLYEVFLVLRASNEFDLVRLISRTREGAKVKAYNMSKFADLDFDRLEIRINELVNWDVDED